MAVDVIPFPAGIYPEHHSLTPDVGPGQTIGQSPFIGSQNVNTMRGAERWRLSLSWDALTGDDRADMMSFVTRLRISNNAFICINHAARNRGSLGGTPVVAIASLNGQYLVVSVPGQVSVASWIRAGDFISVNSQLKMNLTDKGTSAGAVASLEIWPPLYDIPNSGVGVAVSSACGGWRMESVVEMTSDPPGYRTALSIRAIERINSAMVTDFLS